MFDRSSDIVLVFVDATWTGGKEADIYGTPLGLRNLAAIFRKSVESCSVSTLFRTAANGPLVETGLNMSLHLTDDLSSFASISYTHTLRFRRGKRRFFNEDSLEYTTRRPSQCQPRRDGGFAVAYPVIGPDVHLAIAGNATGILHIADHLEWMADIDYGPYRPNWPEHSEHYHSWIDRENDVMLPCGLGLLYGRLDHRKYGSVGWMLEDRSSNRDELVLLVHPPV
jgi:hypothetical protein